MKIDKRVLEAQKWLNTTYGECEGYTVIPEDGHTGSVVMEALVSAVQIELGISPTGYFGSVTESAYEQHQITINSEDTEDYHFVTILQHGLFCKGYNPSDVTGKYGVSTLSAVLKVQRDAGFSDEQLTPDIYGKLFKAILSSDALVLVTGGDKVIRQIQQSLNSKYSSVIGIMPCDGLYGAGLNKALIYAFQLEGGLSTSVANGTFGPATQSIASNHVQTLSDYEANFVKIAQYALYCNGIRRNRGNAFDTRNLLGFTGEFNNKMVQTVKQFQAFAGIMEITGEIGLKEWMSLLVSTGYPKRNVLACDTSTQITDIKAKRIVANDFEIIGRYLTGSTLAGPKNLTREECNILFTNGLKIFAIYQDEKEYYQTHPNEETTENYYNYVQGYNDAEKAFIAADALGIPYGEYIFFAVDYDFTDSQVTKKIIPHFKGICAYARSKFNIYRIGIYGPRNVCTRVCNYSYAELSFVSDMSTGYSGNLGYCLPENWVFDQIREYTQGASDGGFALDCVAASGKYLGFDNILPETTEQNKPSSLDLAEKYFKDILNCSGIYIYENAKISEEIELNFGIFDITIQSSIGSSIKTPSDVEMTKITITNGEYTDTSWSLITNILGVASNYMNAGISLDGNLVFTDEIRWHVNNGYISYGIKLTSENKLSIICKIHKDESVVEGITDYLEIVYIFTTTDSLTTKEEDELERYKNFLELSKVMEVYKPVDWKKVRICLLVILILCVIAIAILSPETIVAVISALIYSIIEVVYLDSEEDSA